MLTYHESDWAVRRWDWLNGGRVVRPKSFCQFWRAATVQASIKWVLLLLTCLPRCMARLIGRAAFSGVVSTGERINNFSERHKEGWAVLGRVLTFVYWAFIIAIIFAIAFSASWFWTLVLAGAAVLTSSVGYGLFRSDALGLLWQAAVAAHHGICPPVEIIRE